MRQVTRIPRKLCQHLLDSTDLTAQTLYESGVAFGLRKALQAEAGVAELEQRAAAKEAEASELRQQVSVLLTVKTLFGGHQRLP